MGGVAGAKLLGPAAAVVSVACRDGGLSSNLICPKRASHSTFASGLLAAWKVMFAK